MLNTELTSLIPDQPYDEFAPVGSMKIPWHHRLYSRTVRGYQGIGRRVWVNRGHPSDELLVLDIEIERVHSPAVAAKAVRSALPTQPVISRLREHELTSSTSGDEPHRIMWKSGNVYFRLVLDSVGPFVVEAATATLDGEGDEALASESFLRAKSSVQSMIGVYQPGWGFLAVLLGP